MAYLRPSAFERTVFSKIAMAFGIGGSTTLIVPGRRSGKPVKLPVNPIEVDGARYLVSTRGEGQWVRNLRAAGMKGELRRKGKAEQFVATEVATAERQPIVDAYRAKVGKYVDRYWAALPDAADHPVFRIAAPA